MSETAIAVLVCRDACPGLLAAPADSAAVPVEDLCERPDAAAQELRRAGASRAVLGVCAPPSRDLLGALPRAGAVPFGIQSVVLAGRDPDEARVLIGGAVARLGALAPGERGKPRITDGAVSRRSLFSRAAVLYDAPVAVLDAEACTGTAGCGICIERCPHGAVDRASGTSPAGRVPAVDADRCAGCGVCVSACPSGALRLSGCSTAQVEAQLDALLEHFDGLVLACESARPDGEALPRGWARIELPTLGLLTPGWLLQLRLRGVATRLAPCEGRCCEGALELEALAGRLIAAGAGHQPAPAAGEPPISPGEPLRLTEPRATADAVRRIADGLPVLDDRAPLGLVSFDPERCTVCGACALACPTGALALEQADDSGAVLLHDPAACVACDRCARACPEQALGVARGIDGARLRAGPIELIRDQPERCLVCGAQLPPRPLRRRLRELLPFLADAPLELCTGCGARAASASRAPAPRG